MGSATTAPTGPFHQERVRASHQAIGVPITSSSVVVTLASLRVSQMAARSAALKHGWQVYRS
jgi:hypothetical protein